MVIDDLLRSCGFKIHDRHDRDEPVWVSSGKKYIESVAIRIAFGMLNEETMEKYGVDLSAMPAAKRKPNAD